MKQNCCKMPHTIMELWKCACPCHQKPQEECKHEDLLGAKGYSVCRCGKTRESLRIQPESQEDSWEKEFLNILRLDIGYSGGAMDSDIVSCETIGGRKSSMRFDVLAKSIIKDVRQLLLSEREPWDRQLGIMVEELAKVRRALANRDNELREKIEGIGVCKRCRDLLNLEICHTKTQKKEENNGEDGQ